MEVAVLAANERLRQPVGVVDEVEREAALDAEVAFVREVLRLRRDLDDVLRLRVEIEVDLAADTAERARRAHLFQLAFGLLRALLELLVDRTRRADREAAAAELALGVEPGALPGGDDARVPAAALERERGALHDLLRVPDAAVAEDARVRVVAHQAVPVVVLLALGVGEHERRLGAELVREVEQLVRATSGRRFRCSESSISVSVLRKSVIGPFVEMTIPSAIRVAQAGADAAHPRPRPRTCGSRRTARACRRGRGWG